MQPDPPATHEHTDPPNDGKPRWIDLRDPDEATLRAALPPGIHETAMDRILLPARQEPRPRLESQGTYVFGVLAFPAVSAGGAVVFQEVDVIANLDVLVTIRKTPVGHTACEFDDARNAALTSPIRLACARAVLALILLRCVATRSRSSSSCISR